MKFSTLTFSALAIVVLALSSCQTNLATAFQRKAPDEFEVMPRAKLSMPSQFSLPQPGEASEVQQESISAQAQELLTGHSIAESKTSVQPKNLSALEKKFAANTGAHEADASIRKTITEERKEDDGLLGIADAASFRNKTIDPKKENARIKKLLSENKPITEGEVETKGNLDRFKY